MHRCGVTNYEKFARDLLAIVTDKPISFEVLSDDFDDMRRQAVKIASWGENVYVKIPITNSRKETSLGLIRSLTDHGTKVNVTAITTTTQVHILRAALNPEIPCIVSVFAGRIADGGICPIPIMRNCAALLAPYKKAELLWASTREVLNIVQAEESGCHIITVPNDILAKAEKTLGLDMDGISLDVIRMFLADAKVSGLSL